jgi:hypothetical protein
LDRKSGSARDALGRKLDAEELLLADRQSFK